MYIKLNMYLMLTYLRSIKEMRAGRTCLSGRGNKASLNILCVLKKKNALFE